MKPSHVGSSGYRPRTYRRYASRFRGAQKFFGAGPHPWGKAYRDHLSSRLVCPD